MDVDGRPRGSLAAVHRPSAGHRHLASTTLGIQELVVDAGGSDSHYPAQQPVELVRVCKVRQTTGVLFLKRPFERTLTTSSCVA